MVPRLADEEVTELARVDRQAHEDFGRDETAWLPWQWRLYWLGLDEVHAQFPHREAA